MSYTREQIEQIITQGCNSSNTCQPCVNCKDDWRLILKHIDDDHPYHCAARMIWGDGECECQNRQIDQLSS